jgi:hypothetical protein
LKKKDSASKESVSAYLAKHSFEKFQKEVLVFISDVKGAQEPTFLEQVILKKILIPTYFSSKEIIVRVFTSQF